MIYTIFKDDPKEIKYEIPGVAIQNTFEQSRYLGDTALHRTILSKAKHDKEKTIGIYQARRCLAQHDKVLTEDVLTAKDKVYHTMYRINGTNLNLWYASHPLDKYTLVEVFNRAADKMPQYRHAFDACLESNIIYPHNMWIMPTELAEKYIDFEDWALNLMDLSLKQTPKIGSLLAERLYTAWCNLNIPQKDQIFTDAFAFDKQNGAVINRVNGVAD